MFKKTDGDRMGSEIMGSDFIVMEFSHSEVSAGRLGDALDRLMQLSDSKDMTGYWGHLTMKVTQIYLYLYVSISPYPI